jgi:hypothetical protein
MHKFISKKKKKREKTNGGKMPQAKIKDGTVSFNRKEFQEYLNANPKRQESWAQ